MTVLPCHTIPDAQWDGKGLSQLLIVKMRLKLKTNLPKKAIQFYSDTYFGTNSLNHILY